MKTLRLYLRSSMVVMLTLVVSSAGASATVFTDAASFDAANPGLPVLDFEGIVTAGSAPAPDFSAQGVTFSDPSGDTSLVLVSSASTFGTPSDYLAEVNSDVPLVMHFNPGVTAAGFDLALFFAGGEATIEAFNGTSLLDSVTLTAAAPANFDTFVGFSGLGDITEIQVTPGTPPPGDVFLVFVDNVTFGVPEPASLSLLGVGLIFGLRRRRAAR